QQCDDRVVPLLVRLERRVLLALLEEARGLDDLQRIRRSGQHDRDEIVRVERYLADELRELVLRENLRLIRGRVRGLLRERGPTRAERAERERPERDAEHGSRRGPDDA